MNNTLGMMGCLHDQAKCCLAQVLYPGLLLVSRQVPTCNNTGQYEQLFRHCTFCGHQFCETGCERITLYAIACLRNIAHYQVPGLASLSNVIQAAVLTEYASLGFNNAISCALASNCYVIFAVY